MSLWSIFWRTFAQLALAVLLAVQVPDLVDETWIKNTGAAVGLGLLVAFIGGLVAVLWAWGLTPATTALEKATRSAAQAAAGVLGALVLNSAADLVALPKVLVGGLVTVVLAFAVTYFQNQGPVPTPATTGHQS
jgi:hypothetical protein